MARQRKRKKEKGQGSQIRWLEDGKRKAESERTVQKSLMRSRPEIAAPKIVRWGMITC